MRAPTLTKIPLDNQKTINIPLDFISAEVLSNQLNQIRNWIFNSKTKQSQNQKPKNHSIIPEIHAPHAKGWVTSTFKKKSAFTLRDWFFWPSNIYGHYPIYPKKIPSSRHTKNYCTAKYLVTLEMTRRSPAIWCHDSCYIILHTCLFLNGTNSHSLMLMKTPISTLPN